MPDDTKVPTPGSQAYQRGPHDETASPRDLKVKIAEQRLVIDWKDGTQSEYALDELRRRCPCATCRTEREQRDTNPLHILKSDPSGVRVTSANLVGQYAIQFIWSDGHSTGIFDFRFLKALADPSPGREPRPIG